MATSDRPGATRVESPEGATVSDQPPPRVTTMRGDFHAEPANPENWGDRVRWGPVWAGTLVALTTFIFLQLLFFALGWLDLRFDGENNAGARSIVTGGSALIAFFVGGLLASASSMRRGSFDGLLHGVLVWALSALGIITLAAIGGTSLLGPLAELVGQTTIQPQNLDIDPEQAATTARQTAGWAALGLGLAVAAAGLGGVVGSKAWPRANHTANTR